MLVYLNKYKNHWISPYTICEKICFWREIDYDEPWVKAVNKALEPTMTKIMKVLNVIHPKIDYVKIDRWDTWSMDHTLAHIVLPMLKQLQKDKHGSPYVEDEDVPEELRSEKKSKRKKKGVAVLHTHAVNFEDDDIIVILKQKPIRITLEEIHDYNNVLNITIYAKYIDHYFESDFDLEIYENVPLTKTNYWEDFKDKLDLNESWYFDVVGNYFDKLKSTECVAFKIQTYFI